MEEEVARSKDEDVGEGELVVYVHESLDELVGLDGEVNQVDRKTRQKRTHDRASIYDANPEEGDKEEETVNGLGGGPRPAGLIHEPVNVQEEGRAG